MPISPAPAAAAPPAPAPSGRRLWRVAIPSWPFLAAGGLLLAWTAYFVVRVLRVNDGQWVYPIDDAYGHLAVAKNLLRHGTWTYSAPNGFDSGDSSLAWPWLLAASFLFTGVNAWSTLILNVVAALGLLWYADRVLRRRGTGAWLACAVLVAVVALVPLPLLTVIGMEHCFHALVFLVFLDVACRFLAREADPADAPPRWVLPAAACLLTCARFEGMFPVGFVCLLLLCRREWRLAFATGGAAAAPIIAFGLFSLSRGWAFLPCSVLLKGSRPAGHSPAELWTYAQRGFWQMLDNWHVLFLVTALVVLLLVRLARDTNPWRYPVLLLGLTLATLAAHLQFAALGWFYRYEGYLLAVGIVAIGVALAGERSSVDASFATPTRPRHRPGAWLRGAARTLAVGIFVTPAARRTVESLTVLVPACHNIYGQQFQMGRFLRRYYQGQGVAANDIGNIAYAADVRLLDTAGLVNMDVMRHLRANTYDQATLRRLLARYDVKVVVVYDIWAGFYGGQLPEWGLPIGRWTIPNNRVCASETVSFYAPRPELAPALTRALQDFSSSLPAEVIQEGGYRGTPPPHALGVYFPVFDAEGTYYWSSHYADFYLQAEHNQPAPPPGAALAVSVQPRTPGQTMDILVNGEAVQRRTFTAEETGAWVPLLVRGAWRGGTNVVSFIGAGKTVIPPDDNRPILFGVREPRWTVLPP